MYYLDIFCEDNTETKCHTYLFDQYESVREALTKENQKRFVIHEVIITSSIK